MSSMVSRIAIARSTAALLALPLLGVPAACLASDQSADYAATAPSRTGDGSDWDRARANLLQSMPADMSGTIANWRSLTTTPNNYTFSTFASFLISNPGWPDEDKMRRNAEQALGAGPAAPQEVVAFFNRFPPLTNVGRARYAMALDAMGQRDAARGVAVAAWRGGTMMPEDKMQLFSRFGTDFTAADHDARMDALLWARATPDAEEQFGYVSAERRAVFAARLAMLKNLPDADALAGSLGAEAMRDSGYVAQRARRLVDTGNWTLARQMLASRPALQYRPVNAEGWYELLLSQARAASNDGQYALAFDIASKVDDAFAQGHDISDESLGVRDDYTSLTWLAGTVALQNLGRPRDAIGMFARYGGGARTPQTRSKGFYWAGRAAAVSGDQAEAMRYFEMAAAYPDHYYGQLATERLGREIAPFAEAPRVQVSAVERGRFNASSLVQATQAISRSGDWPTQRRFFGAVAASAKTPEEHVLAAELARQIGRRDLAVIVGQAARSKGVDDLQSLAFPQMPVPPGSLSSWTMIHAITRQESQYAPNAVSHAGARGLMQLMPGTAREQAGKMGLSYSLGALTDDTQYNIQLGAGYFSRMMDYFGGSYPLAVAAYNAGPGNVNKWLRANGDPRMGGIDIVEWVERIPIFETKNYVQRVLENAVVYDVMHPERANMRGRDKLSRYLGKNSPG
ncbi:transglycosylase SLT domain-containing protein [Blastomonas sp. SL216]|uniref:transglycosylase SLT domain-containing protein n=1 Tax=Blastomonas sp. SL216 TaxID=2995169 RepID=UPI002377C023|nr:lytic transglycosylase domain-containing protein [Blastomonas sp. SL216]